MVVLVACGASAELPMPMVPSSHSISTTSQPRKRKPEIEPVTSETRSLAVVQKCGGIGATGPTHS